MRHDAAKVLREFERARDSVKIDTYTVVYDVDLLLTACLNTVNIQVTACRPGTTALPHSSSPRDQRALNIQQPLAARIQEYFNTRFSNQARV